MPPVDRARRGAACRAAGYGAVAGFVVAPVAHGAALLSATAEDVAGFLTPGVALLVPLQERMADWPGLVNVLLGSALNGVVVGGACLVAARVTSRWRPRR